jgi:hypothetical protein
VNLVFDLDGIEADSRIFPLVFTLLCYVWSLIRRRKEIDFNVGNKTDPLFCFQFKMYGFSCWKEVQF